MPSMAPYRLQIFLPDEVREALRNVAHKERTSLQKLVLAWLLEKLHDYPEGQDLWQDDARPQQVSKSGLSFDAAKVDAALARR